MKAPGGGGQQPCTVGEARLPTAMLEDRAPALEATPGARTVPLKLLKTDHFLFLSLPAQAGQRRSSDKEASRWRPRTPPPRSRPGKAFSSAPTSCGVRGQSRKPASLRAEDSHSEPHTPETPSGDRPARLRTQSPRGGPGPPTVSPGYSAHLHRLGAGTPGWAELRPRGSWDPRAPAPAQL